jgi:type IV pilus assembly protein PilW
MRVASPVIRRQRGLTLVELMVALLVGLIVSAAVLRAYVETVRSTAQHERYARMQENGRYALRILSEDLLMSDFWGQMRSADGLTTALSLPAGDCGEAIDAYDGRVALLYNGFDGAGPAHFTPCATIATTQAPGTGQLAIKRVGGTPTARTFVDTADINGNGDTTEVLTLGADALEPGVVYLRTNGVTGRLIADAAAGNPPALGESDWEYRPRIYFVRDHFDAPGDGLPSLCRLEMEGNGLGGPRCIAEGIAGFHLEFGIDDTGDGVANRYLTAPAAADMNRAVTTRVYVLARSATPDPLHSDARTYVLGSLSVGPFGDGFYRGVYATTVSLRNTTYRSLLE